jgi:hypothetical protein
MPNSKWESRRISYKQVLLIRKGVNLIGEKQWAVKPYPLSRKTNVPGDTQRGLFSPGLELDVWHEPEAAPPQIRTGGMQPRFAPFDNLDRRIP